jgi:hypothetical protein
MTEHEEITKILKDKIERSVKEIEAGGSAHVSGGYLRHSREEKIIDSHCSNIFNKLVSLGYEYTDWSGHGCKDYTFTKKIEL